MHGQLLYTLQLLAKGVRVDVVTLHALQPVFALCLLRFYHRMGLQE